MSEVHVREMAENDWFAVSTIYQDGIDTGHATQMGSLYSMTPGFSAIQLYNF